MNSVTHSFAKGKLTVLLVTAGGPQSPLGHRDPHHVCRSTRDCSCRMRSCFPFLMFSTKDFLMLKSAIFQMDAMMRFACEELPHAPSPAKWNKRNQVNALPSCLSRTSEPHDTHVMAQSLVAPFALTCKTPTFSCMHDSMTL